VGRFRFSSWVGQNGFVPDVVVRPGEIVEPVVHRIGGAEADIRIRRHRHQEFIRFLNAIEVAVPVGRLVHAILDNYATHKHPKVLAWLSRYLAQRRSAAASRVGPA
jgi:hypothetical protein